MNPPYVVIRKIGDLSLVYGPFTFDGPGLKKAHVFMRESRHLGYECEVQQLCDPQPFLDGVADRVTLL